MRPFLVPVCVPLERRRQQVWATSTRGMANEFLGLARRAGAQSGDQAPSKEDAARLRTLLGALKDNNDVFCRQELRTRQPKPRPDALPQLPWRVTAG